MCHLESDAWSFTHLHRVRAQESAPQLIAQALGAFTHNRTLRAIEELPILESYTFPGITMKGSYPILYKIPVTGKLVDAVNHCQHPPDVTLVKRLMPPGLDEPNLESGFLSLQNRRIWLQCFEAFKALLVSFS